jgi:hypothetical protein
VYFHEYPFYHEYSGYHLLTPPTTRNPFATFLRCNGKYGQWNQYRKTHSLHEKLFHLYADYVYPAAGSHILKFPFTKKLSTNSRVANLFSTFVKQTQNVATRKSPGRKNAPSTYRGDGRSATPYRRK